MPWIVVGVDNSGKFSAEFKYSNSGKFNGIICNK